MTPFDILTALRQKDYHTANQGFARVMQEKLADRLAVEKRDVTQQALTEVITEATMSAHEVQRVYNEIGDVKEVELICGISGLRVNENGQVITYVTEAYDPQPMNNDWLKTMKKIDDRHDKDKKPKSKKVTEAIDRPNSSGQGYDDDYMHNPYHGVIRKYGYEYSHSTPVTHGAEKLIHHTYKQGDHNVSVWGNKWSTSTGGGSGRMFTGGHPNTDRAAGDLERHLRDKARRYGLTESKMQYDNDGRINKGATYKVVSDQGTTLGKGLSKDDAKNQCKNYHDATGKMAYYQTEAFGGAVAVMSGWDKCDMCDKVPNWRGKDPKTGVVLASACYAHKDVVKNALIQKLQGIKK